MSSEVSHWLEFYDHPKLLVVCLPHMVLYLHNKHSACYVMGFRVYIYKSCAVPCPNTSSASIKRQNCHPSSSVFIMYPKHCPKFLVVCSICACFWYFTEHIFTVLEVMLIYTILYFMLSVRLDAWKLLAQCPSSTACSFAALKYL